MTERKTFEPTYRRHQFPMLVEFGIALSKLLLRKQKTRPAPSAKAVPPRPDRPSPKREEHTRRPSSILGARAALWHESDRQNRVLSR